MPRSKRAKVVPGSKVTKGTDRKEKLIQKTRAACAQHRYVYLLDLENCRSSFLLSLRQRLRPSQLIYGNNKLLQVALGNGPQDELKEGISRISKQLKYEKCLLFTDLPESEVKRHFAEFQPADFAKAGSVALSTVTLAEGPEALQNWPHSMETQFRQLGLPTILKNGAIHLLGNYTVCTEGEALTPAAAQLLKKLDVKTTRFKVNIEDMWTNPDPLENEGSGGGDEGEEEGDDEELEEAE
uniref:Ribosome assembly factor mrt4 n=1 Tax=Chromera velia CCMP2878 TaxID=1169474 RepID=A0A0G4GX41_9ALVE|eukprot:Cvel_5352.t1-p1 / transcript=Cvel_5352.t1 / gene=Cvel_5352 / organism=Chromera_velia_CCMP2878 / gene_product=mRNA turnover protein 4 homolog, putative / transcript_product=mRNA turnover protein 4 homolog, putative / location=Cvel_scaffold248:48988-51948(+) / protein_length=239 / sequence_SO=supercontig / SO=protein_coding / is_pseudo=false